MPIAGSELVIAVGRLHQQARDPSRAAATLRDGLRRSLTERLGLAPDADPAAVADASAARTAVDRDRVHAALVGYHVRRDADLVELARLVSAVRREVLDEQPT